MAYVHPAVAERDVLIGQMHGYIQQLQLQQADAQQTLLHAGDILGARDEEIAALREGAQYDSETINALDGEVNRLRNELAAAKDRTTRFQTQRDAAIRVEKTYQDMVKRLQSEIDRLCGEEGYDELHANCTKFKEEMKWAKGVNKKLWKEIHKHETQGRVDDFGTSMFPAMLAVRRAIKRQKEAVEKELGERFVPQRNKAELEGHGLEEQRAFLERMLSLPKKAYKNWWNRVGGTEKGLLGDAERQLDNYERNNKFVLDNLESDEPLT